MSTIQDPTEDARRLAEEATRALSAGELTVAESAAERALALFPGVAPLVNLLGLVRLAQRRFADAEVLFSRAARADRRGAAYHANRGTALNALGRVEEALESLRRASQLAPSDPQVLNNFGNALFSAGCFEDATAVLRKAASLAPDWSTPRVKLGDALLKRGRLSDARDEYAQAYAADPGSRDAMAALAFALYRLGEPEKAENLYASALSAGRRDVAILATLGVIATLRGDLKRAEEYLREAIATDPTQQQAHMNLASLLLLTGRLNEGWHAYRARSARAAVAAAEGGLVESLAGLAPGTRIIVRGEQGLGDQLFFLRWLPALRRRGFRLIIQSDPRLSGMLGRSPDVQPGELACPVPSEKAGVIAAGDLPVLLGETDEYPAGPRLVPEESAAAAVAGRLRASGPPPYVCVAWRAGTALAEQGAIASSLSKSIPLDALAAALRGVAATIISVQRNPAAGENERLAELVSAPVHDLSDVNADLEAALALMATADEYVGVSSANVHLRHASARISRVVVPNPPEWRWGTAGPSPWFPGTRVYREIPSRGWVDAVGQLREDLKETSR